MAVSTYLKADQGGDRRPQPGARASHAAGEAGAGREEGGGQRRTVRGELLKFPWSLECPGYGFKVNGEDQPKPLAAVSPVRPLQAGPGRRLMVRTATMSASRWTCSGG